MEKNKTETPAEPSSMSKEVISFLELKNELVTSYKEALSKLAKSAADGDLEAIKLLNEAMQDAKELKLRKELFGV